MSPIHHSEMNMDKFEEIPTDGQIIVDAQLQKKAWIAPAFEQVSLKQALNNAPTEPLEDDLLVTSS